MSTEAGANSKKRRSKETHDGAHHSPKKLKSSQFQQHSIPETVNMEQVQVPSTNGHISSEKKIVKDKKKNKTNGTVKEVDTAKTKTKKELLEDLEPKTSKKKSKKKDTKLLKHEEQAEDQQPVSVLTSIDSMSHQVSIKPEGHRIVPWIISEQSGGRFLPLDPVFSLNEKFLLLATESALNIYSTSTSLLIRTLHTNRMYAIVDYSISTVDSSYVYVLTADGSVTLWNWEEGKEASQLDFGCPIHAISATSTSKADSETLFMITSTQVGETDRYHIVSYTTTFKQSVKEARFTEHYSTESSLWRLKIFQRGDVVFSASDKSVVVGKIDTGSKTPAAETFNSKSGKKYIWKTLSLPEGLTSLDAREDLKASLSERRTDRSQAPSEASYDLAIGSRGGAIFVYHDILRELRQAGELKPRVLHWHRGAVGAAKWSLDGNYIVSGGAETVLELWQLDTGKRQDLPHLASTIEAITVSPTGTSYGLRLGDNSMLVLSTTELAPKASVAGLQSRISSGPPENMYAKTLALSSLLNKSQILLAVPASQQGSRDKAWFTAAPFIQTFDLSSGRHVARQAFARNNATNFNVGPGAVKISESNIVHMQASMDGKWLATAEHWTPPNSDVKYLASDLTDEQIERTQRRETYIKFWLWNESKEQWILEARIESPHQSETVPSANRILDLVADPKSIGFASTGEDGIVRIWKPKTKLRDGTIVRGARQDGLITWLCSRAIEVERTIQDAELDHDIQFHGIPKVAKLAFSDDASILAISQDGLEPLCKGIVHFIDTDSGLVKSSQSRMYLSGLTGMQFLDRYLVVLSDDVQVWDVVTSMLVYDYQLQLPDLLPVEIRATTHLAVSTSHDRFVVAHAMLDDDPNNEPRIRARLLVFEPSNSQPLLKVDLPNVVTSVIPIHGSPGFAVIDSAAELRTVKPSTAATIDIERIGLVANSNIESEVVEAEDVEMADEEGLEEPDPIDQGYHADVDQSDKPVVRPEQLAEIFDVAPSFALPTVQDLFHAVAGLYAQKPPARATVVAS